MDAYYDADVDAPGKPPPQTVPVGADSGLPCPEVVVRG